MPDPTDLAKIAVQALAACGTPEDCACVAAYLRELADRVENHARRRRDDLDPVPDAVVPAVIPPPEPA